MSDTGFDYSIVRYLPLSRQVAEDLAVREADFFVSRGNGSISLVGRGTLAQRPPIQIVFPDTMIRLRLANQVRSWVACIWPSKFMRRQIEDSAKTTAGIWKINQNDLRQFVIRLPCVAEQGEIVTLVEDAISVIDATEKSISYQIQRAARLRQSILKRAFEGKLVPQEPADEPAEELLARIQADRQSEGGAIRKQRTRAGGRGGGGGGKEWNCLLQARIKG